MQKAGFGGNLPCLLCGRHDAMPLIVPIEVGMSFRDNWPEAH